MIKVRRIMSSAVLFAASLMFVNCNNQKTESNSMSSENKSNKILVVVDLQRDFIDGSLPAFEADQAVAAIDSVKGRFDKVYFTLDWHPFNHCSFEANGGIWPVHCVHYSLGASIPDHIIAGIPEENTRFFVKGTNPKKEEYGAFDNIDINSQDLFYAKDTVVVCGIAADYCVLETLKNITKMRNSLGFNLQVFIEGTAKITTFDTLLDFMKQNNIAIYE